MTDMLLNAVRRYARAHTDAFGVADTPIPGLTTICATRPSGLDYAISQPLVCLVLQGKKQVTMRAETLKFGAGDSLLIAADVPTVSRITDASQSAPYFSLVLNLDWALIAELRAEIGATSFANSAPVQVAPTGAEAIDTALRLMRLLDRPEAIPILQASLLRELHYWLLCGQHGPTISRLGVPEGHVQRIARAVSILRAEFARPVRIERLAQSAGMSPSSFHRHFRSVTSLTPLQFQKQLRLIEARRLMQSENISASNAAFAVGYESVPQFTREYGRLFGLPPVRDRKAMQTTQVQARRSAQRGGNPSRDSGLGVTCSASLGNGLRYCGNQ